MRARSAVSLLPFKVIPKKMVIHLMYHAIMWINSSPTKTGVSDKYSSRELVTGRTMDYDRHCPVIWGEYVEGHINPTITNTMAERTFSGIYLGTMGNLQGTPKVFDIKTGTVKQPTKVTVFPTP